MKPVFPGSQHYKWNMDHYGPIYIPQKRDTLRIDTVSLALYTQLIRDYEGEYPLISGTTAFLLMTRSLTIMW